MVGLLRSSGAGLACTRTEQIVYRGGDSGRHTNYEAENSTIGDARSLFIARWRHDVIGDKVRVIEVVPEAALPDVSKPGLLARLSLGGFP